MLKDSKTICLTAVTLKEQTDERKEWNFFSKEVGGRKGATGKHTSRQCWKNWCPAVNSITHTATKEQDSKKRAKLECTCSPTLVGQLGRLAIKVPVKLARTSARKCHFLPPSSFVPHWISHWSPSHVRWLTHACCVRFSGSLVQIQQPLIFCSDHLTWTIFSSVRLLKCTFVFILISTNLNK